MAAALLAVAATAAESVAKPVLRVGTSGDYPPFSVVDSAGARSGFSVAVARRMASDLGFEAEFRAFDWPDLSQAVASGAFDVAMSGVTWRPERAVAGWMSLAVAAGGPCVVSAGGEPPQRVAVNRGGILERWTRARFSDAAADPVRIVAVDDNLSLPGRLERGEVDAFVTDSFEVEHFSRAGWHRRCEPPRDRKVFWVAPHRADPLGPAVDAWIRGNEAWLDGQRRKWFGRGQPRDGADHLLDLTARRLAFMPAVATWKSQRGIPILDPERERRVLDSAAATAREFGLAPAPVRDWFAMQIDLAKAVQRRTANAPPTLSLEAIRPALIRLGRRQTRALQATIPEPAPEDFLVLDPHLEPAELERLRRGLRRLLEDLGAP